MKTFEFIKYNKAKIVIKQGGSLHWTNAKWEDKTFTEITDLDNWKDLSNLTPEFSTAADNINQAYYNYVGYLIKLRDKKREEKKIYDDRMREIESNPDNYSPIEIYQCAVYLNKAYQGYRGADLLLKSKVFANKLFEHFKTFTVTPFDNGLLLVKCDNSNNLRFGNHRGYKDLTDYLK